MTALMAANRLYEIRETKIHIIRYTAFSLVVAAQRPRTARSGAISSGLGHDFVDEEGRRQGGNDQQVLHDWRHFSLHRRFGV